MIITASTGYMQSGEKQLVDMSNWYSKNKDTAFNDYNLTNATLEYFKSVKPTSLKKAFEFRRNLNKNILSLNLLDTSECVNFNTFLYVYSDLGQDNSSIIVNLSSLNTSNVTNFEYCLSFSSFSFGSLVIDISSWNTEKGENFSNFLYFFTCGGNDLTVKGIIDLSSDKTTYDGNFYKFINGNRTQLTEPIKLKNVPSDFNWKKAGFTSEDQFQILSYR